MPVISNATVVSGTGFSTQGNGGKKLTRLQNGALIAATRSGTTAWQLRKSVDNGANWSQIATVTETVNDLALASKGNDIHVLVSFSTTGVKHYRYNDSGTLQGTSVNLDSGQSVMDNVSIAINDAGTELHAAWSSRNGTYPNSFNIRYAKGTINPDGSVTWGAVVQISMRNNVTGNNTSPSVSLTANGLPVLVWSLTDTAGSDAIYISRFNGTSWSGGSHAEGGHVFQLNGRTQSNPSAIFVPQSINGLANGRLWVAWHGKDATDSAKFNIRVSFSDDGGVTWSTPVKLTSGNTFDRLNVSLSADKSGKVFALYEDHQWAPDLGIRMKTFNGTWGAEVGVATADTAEQHPSALVDYSLQMTTPPFVYTDTTTGIRFTGNFNVGASVSPVSGALGNKETASLTAYTVTPEAGSTVTQIVERVNGVITNTFNNPASLSRTLTVPTATWDTLAYFASHTASVTVTDSNGAQTVTTYSFDKRLATGASLLEATKANNDAKNRIAAKKDALAAQVGLSAGATFDAISAQLASGQVFKKFQPGTSTSNGGGVISVTSLSFKPMLVFVYKANPSPTYKDTAILTSLVSETNNVYINNSDQSIGYTLASLTNNGFSIRVQSVSSQYSWVAFG